MKQNIILTLVLLAAAAAPCDTLEHKPADPYYSQVQPLAAPHTRRPVLQAGDRLAICGDSITEQRMYSRIMETYLTVSHPELSLGIRQFGWSGEQASGFLKRMTNDVLRFHPSVATTCYGMNDHHYRPYEESIGREYGSNMTAVIEAFKAAGTRVVVGSPGCMGFKDKPWGWVQGTPGDRNSNLCNLRNIDIRLAAREHENFADVFWPMYQAQFEAREKWGTNYALAGKDSVHPDWAGHLVMAYAFLKGLDVPGDLGVITVDLKSGRAKATAGHEVVSSEGGAVTIKSSRYPFCATGAEDSAASIRSAMQLVPFNQEFNRLILVVKHLKVRRCRVAWGDASREYSADELKRGVNLAADFQANPFSGAFKAVDEAVAAKQAFETKQVKQLFHGDAGKADMEGTVTDSEKERAKLVDAIGAAFVPVTHTITITPED